MWDVMRGIGRPLQEYFTIGCFTAKNSCHTLPEKDRYKCYVAEEKALLKRRIMRGTTQKKIFGGKKKSKHDEKKHTNSHLQFKDDPQGKNTS